jgi:prolipoprotein diacylglyceryl transferase
VITTVLAPLSIPSPPYDFQAISIPFGSWLHGFLPFVPENQVLTIRAYAIAILIGIVAAVLITQRRLTKRGADPSVVIDIAIWAVPLGIIGARIFHVLSHPADYFGPGKDLWEIIRIDHGGIAIFGALIGGAIGILIASRFTGLRFSAFADALAPGLLVAQAFGRLGNYFNHELFGLPTTLPWGLEIESSNAAYPAGLPAGVLFQPTFLYEIIWNLLGVAVILYLERQWSVEKKTIFGVTLPVPVAGRVRLQWGKVIALYFIWYGIGRTVWESIRIDPSEIFFGIRTNVWAALFSVALGVVILIVQSRRHYGLEPSAYVPGREWTGVVDSAETYSDIEEPGEGATAQSDELVPIKSGTGKPATSGKGIKS